MARYIDADALLEKRWDVPFETNDSHYVQVVDVADIENAPTADVVEVVRCKDCKHYNPQNKSIHWNCKIKYCCRTATIKTNPNDFCSYGERNYGKGENSGRCEVDQDNNGHF